MSNPNPSFDPENVLPEDVITELEELVAEEVDFGSRTDYTKEEMQGVYEEIKEENYNLSLNR